MTWLYLVVPIGVLFVIALIFDRKAKKSGQAFDNSYDGTKNEREQNPQAQNDMHQIYENNDSFFNY